VPEQRRAQLVGTGLIGGSIGLALRARGWHVTGRDRDAERAARALELGALDALGDDPDAELTFVATPVGAVAEEAAKAPGVVTDVGSVKAPVVAAVDRSTFVGGHPMAGSEQEGVEGADAALFQGAVWVLTPVEATDPEAHSLVRSVVSSFGADGVELPPDRHDALVGGASPPATPASGPTSAPTTAWRSSTPSMRSSDRSGGSATSSPTVAATTSWRPWSEPARRG
jgi:prephenate dehydrogenase